MDIDCFFSQVADNARRIRVLAEGISDDQARWKPDLDSWSILEVVNHLLDEEQEDFRVMLDLAVHRPDEPRPRIDPQAWMMERRYNERDLGESLQGFRRAGGVAHLAEGLVVAGLGGGLRGPIRADQGRGCFCLVGGTRPAAHAPARGAALGVHHAPAAAIQGGLRRAVVSGGIDSVWRT